MKGWSNRYSTLVNKLRYFFCNLFSLYLVHTRISRGQLFKMYVRFQAA